MSNKESNIEKTNFDTFIQAVGSEIEQAQSKADCCSQCTNAVPLLEDRQLHPLSPAAARMGKQIIKQLAKAIRLHYPEKKGYSERNLTYMCQFAKAYPLRALQSFIETDASLSVPTIQSVTK